MAINDFASLQTAIADFMNRTDATSVIPSFITLAEAEMNRKLRVRQMVARATAIVSSEFESVPADFCGALAMTLDYTPPIQLEFCDADKINFEKSKWSGTTGNPAIYSVQDDDLQLFPAPSGPFTARMVYFRTIPAISASRLTNWLLTKYPDCYLYGSLSQAGMWLRNEPRLPDWVATFEQILTNIQAANEVEAEAPRLEMPTRLVV